MDPQPPYYSTLSYLVETSTTLLTERVRTRAVFRQVIWLRIVRYDDRRYGVVAADWCATEGLLGAWLVPVVGQGSNSPVGCGLEQDGSIKTSDQLQPWQHLTNPAAAPLMLQSGATPTTGATPGAFSPGRLRQQCPRRCGHYTWCHGSSTTQPSTVHHRLQFPAVNQLDRYIYSVS